ncbi:MAG: 50S ribosomal protein L29 [Nanoarchaeota archaeon]|nr:50S ribosomal protein L29 [Nanoarchaeota archaeon]
MSSQEQQAKLVELRKELMKLNAKRSMGVTLESPGRIRMLKRTIARILTFQHMKSKTGGSTSKT